MPFVRISLLEDTPAKQRQAIGDAVHGALAAAAGVPAEERFQVIERHAPEDLAFDPSFGGAQRERVVFVEITLVAELDQEAKRHLHRELADRLSAEAGVRPDDVFTVLRENTLADWSQLRGEANLLDPNPSA